MTGRLQFSIGIAAYNEEAGLRRLLRFLARESFEDELDEIIVVLSGCTDNSEQVVKAAQKWDKRIHLIVEQQRRGKYSAMNKIVERAKNRRSDAIVFLPADVIPTKGSINCLLAHLRDPHVGCVSGRPIPENTNSLVGVLGRLLWYIHHLTFLHRVSMGLPLTHSSGELMACRLSLIPTLPPITNDDAYIAAKVLERGFRIAYAPSATVRIWCPRSFQDWWRQRRRIIRGHHALKRRGMQVQALTFATPGEAGALLLGLVCKNPSYVPPLLLLGATELLLRILTRLGGREEVVWERVSSAKPPARSGRIVS